DTAPGGDEDATAHDLRQIGFDREDAVLRRGVVPVGKAVRICSDVRCHGDPAGAGEVDEPVRVPHAWEARHGHHVDHRVDDVRTCTQPEHGRDNRVTVV